MRCRPSSSYSNPPCAACKFLRRKCLPGCVFAPYFPPEEPQKFANVHKIFGASNVSKLLNEIQPHQREDAVNSLAYEAEARLKDPVYGCVGAISVLQRQVLRLQKELDATNADLMRYARNEMSCGGHGYHHPTTPDDHNNMNNYHQMYNQQRSSSNNNQYGRSSRVGSGGVFYGQSYEMPNYSSQWTNSSSGEHNPDE
nr:lateral organ boundaries domain protein 19 [Ipomoea batatas]